MMKKLILGLHDTDLIKPAAGRGESDKYSWNLHRFIKRQHPEYHRVYDFQWSWIDGSTVPHNPMNLRHCYIGLEHEDKFISGSKLYSILCALAHGKFEKFAFPPKMTANALDITDWFWPEYIRIGRAIFDRDGSIISPDDRWTIIGNTRRCNWSGQWFKSEVVTEKTFARRTLWRAA